MYLFMCKSLTYAQRSARVLERRGVGAFLMRSPRELSSGGCGYCVRVSEKHFAQAVDILRASSLEPIRIFRVNPDGYTEVTA